MTRHSSMTGEYAIKILVNRFCSFKQQLFVCSLVFKIQHFTKFNNSTLQQKTISCVCVQHFMNQINYKTC